MAQSQYEVIGVVLVDAYPGRGLLFYRVVRGRKRAWRVAQCYMQRNRHGWVLVQRFEY